MSRYAEDTESPELLAIYARFDIPKPYRGTIDHDHGWDGIIIELDQTLAAIDPDYKIHQIKEKFGGLRYYVGFSPGFSQEQYDELWKIVHEYEGKSYVTCEICGAEASTRDGGWIRTLCDEHAQGRNEQVVS